MRLSDYRLKFAELIGPWTTDPSNKKNEILANWDICACGTERVKVFWKITFLLTL